MNRHKLGQTDISVPPIIIGTWQASGWSESNDKNSLQIYERALDLGFNAFDTAPAYGAGHSEELLGKALQGNRDKAVLLTKFSHKDTSPQRIRESLEGSLMRLGTDYIDVYQQHWPCRNSILSSVIDELASLKREGKIRAIGVCNWLEPEWAEVGSRIEIDVLQSCYSLIWRDVERNVAELCRQNSISIICSSPLCQGILAGRFVNNESLPPDPRRQNWWMQGDRFQNLIALLDKVKEIADEHKASMSQVSLAWLLSKPAVSSVIVGQTSCSQLEENYQALELKLSSSNLAQLDDLTQNFSNHDPHESLWGWHSRKGL